jgi:NAD(P)-dependent dehydrogenase (short-subunit alcohol dehydrogenase family)
VTAAQSETARTGTRGAGGRVVVVTGSSGGIGRAIAEELGRHGDRVALLARGGTGLQAAARAVEAAGGTALPLQVDVSDFRAVDSAATEIERTLGPIDVWVNVAFATVFARSWDVTPEEFARTTEVSYLGFVYGTLAALHRMRPRDRGVIVQVGSALAYRGIPLQSAYCGAKHAIQGFHESVRCELLAEGSGVDVTMVQMPGLNTPQFSWVRAKLPHRPQPVPPIYQPEVAGRAVARAIEHPRRRERWVGGSTALTLMANAVVPGILDRYLAKTGIASQQTDEPVDGHRDNEEGNLFQAQDQDRDFGSHGRFDKQGKAHSLQQKLAWAFAGRRNRLGNRAAAHR